MANPIRRAWRWVKSVARAVAGGGISGQGYQLSRLRMFLDGQAPGAWLGDHVEEAEHYKGWPYVATRFLSNQDAQAELHVDLLAPKGEPPHKNPEPFTKKSAAGWRQSLLRKSPKRWAKALRHWKTWARLTKDSPAATPTGHKPEKAPLPPGHRLVKLLKRPNPGQSGAMFRRAARVQGELTGVLLMWVVRDPLGVPAEMYVIPTAAAQPQPPNKEFPMGSYRVSPLAAFAVPWDRDFQPSGALGPLLSTGAVIDARDVIAVKHPHPLYLTDGYGPLAGGSVWVDCAEQMDRSRWYSFVNSASPGMIYKIIDEDVQPSPEDREAFREELRARSAGTQNRGRDMILPPGVDAMPGDRSNLEMDYAATWTQGRDACLALHGTSPPAVGIGGDVSYAAYYAALKQTTDQTVQPALDMLAEAWTYYLGPIFAKLDGLPEHAYEIGLKARAVDDPTLLEARVNTQIAARSITANEERKLRGMPPVPWGHVQAGTVVNIDPKTGEVQGLPPPTPEGVPGTPGRPGEKPGLAPGKPTATTTGNKEPTRNAVPGRPANMNGTAGAKSARRGRRRAWGREAVAALLDGWEAP